MKKLRNFIGWFAFYRQGQHVVTDLGRWESFCRALSWTFRSKK